MNDNDNGVLLILGSLFVTSFAFVARYLYLASYVELDFQNMTLAELSSSGISQIQLFILTSSNMSFGITAFIASFIIFIIIMAVS